MDRLVKVIATVRADRVDPRTQAQRSRSSPGTRSSPRIGWPLAIASIAAFLIVAASVWLLGLQDIGNPGLQEPRPPALSDDRLGQSFRLRERGELGQAVAVLSQLLDASPSLAVRAQAFRDRAFCYKLQEKWPESIADLSTALALGTSSSDATGMALNDRAYAYLQIPDLDAALVDYETLSQLKPNDREATANRDLFRALLKPRYSGFLFVFMPTGPVNSSAMLPAGVQALALDHTSFLNLRFWWHPIRFDEVRYTAPTDEAKASIIVAKLRASGLDVKGPTLISGTIPRSHRIEVWLRAREKTN